ncbi:MAG TPA: hypothetical protein VGC41_13330, partial [Kofleriaceae bacterium]
APKGTTLEVLALVGRVGLGRGATDAIEATDVRTPIGMATRLWAETLHDTGQKVRYQQFARRFEGVEFVLDCAAMHAGMPQRPDRPPLTDQERTVAAAAGLAPVDALEASDHPQLVRAIAMGNEPERLDDLAHEILLGVAESGRDQANAFLAGEPRYYRGTAPNLIIGVLQRVRGTANPRKYAFQDLAHAALFALDHEPLAERGREYLAAIEAWDVQRYDDETVSLVIAAWAKAGELPARYLENGRLHGAYLSRLDGLATCEYALMQRDAEILDARIPVLTRASLVDVIPALLVLEPGCEPILREGLHAADDALATLHIV